MANGSIITDWGRKLILNRSFKSSPDYNAPAQFGVGINNPTPNVADQDLSIRIPITDGTIIHDGSGTFTGSNDADNSDTTTTFFKQGAGTTDGTANSMLAETAGTLKTWTADGLANTGTAKPFGFWLYFSTRAFGELVATSTTGTAVEMRFGSDSSNYYWKKWDKSDLAAGWNWLTTGTLNLNDLSEFGSVSGNYDTFILNVETGATGTFHANDCVFDLARQWETTDLIKSYEVNYPTVNETTLEAEMRGILTVNDANGFNIDGFADFNDDSTIKMATETTFTDESKSSTDQFTFISKVRLI